jgi:diguanylate cyclase (GGDEF)-like protein
VLNAKAILNGDPSVEPGYLNNPTRFSTLRSALSVPLEGVESVLGAFTVYRTGANAFSKDNQRVLSAICSKLALAIENALKLQHAKDSAATDHVTGLPNAHSMLLHLHREIARAKRSDAELCVIACRLEGLKHVRERHGKTEANRLLKMFSSCTVRSCREYDYVACTGTDEFVIIAPGVKAGTIQELTERVIDIARQVGRELGDDGGLSVSIGKAVLTQDGSDAELLLAHADRRMHAARLAYANLPVATPAAGPTTGAR